MPLAIVQTPTNKTAINAQNQQQEYKLVHTNTINRMKKMAEMPMIIQSSWLVDAAAGFFSGVYKFG